VLHRLGEPKASSQWISVGFRHASIDNVDWMPNGRTHLNTREVALESDPEEEARSDNFEIAKDLVGSSVHVGHGVELHIVVTVPGSTRSVSHRQQSQWAWLDLGVEEGQRESNVQKVDYTRDREQHDGSPVQSHLA
jgi:hypothetical protein